MPDNLILKLIAISTMSLISLLGSFWTRSNSNEEIQVAPQLLIVDTSLTIAPSASTTLPAPSTTTTSTTTTLPPPEAIRPTVKTVPADPAKRCRKLEPLLAQYGLHPVDVFSYIAWRESGCRPEAVNAKWDKAGNVTWTLNKNGSIDRGLLQINSSWVTVVSQICKSPRGDMEVLFDLDCNLRVARYLLGDGSGLSNWGF